MALSQLLVEQNFPAIAIHKAMSQDERSVSQLHHTWLITFTNATFVCQSDCIVCVSLAVLCRKSITLFDTHISPYGEVSNLLRTR